MPKLYKLDEKLRKEANPDSLLQILILESLLKLNLCLCRAEKGKQLIVRNAITEVEGWTDATTLKDKGALLFDTRRRLQQMIRGSDIVILSKAFHNLTTMRWQADTAFHEFRADFDTYSTEIKELGKAYEYSSLYLTFSSMPQEFRPIVQAYFEEHAMGSTFNVVELWKRLAPIGQNYDSRDQEETTQGLKSLPGVNVNAAAYTRSRRSRGKSATKSMKFCTYHGDNPSHTTGECFTLKAKERKESKSETGRSGHPKSKSYSKTSNRIGVNHLSQEFEYNKGQYRIGIDSQTTDNLVQDRDIVHDLTYYDQPQRVTCVNDTAIPNLEAIGEGKIVIRLKDGKNSDTLTVHNVILVQSEHPTDLILLRATGLMKDGISMIAGDDRVHMGVRDHSYELEVINNQWFIPSKVAEVIRPGSQSRSTKRSTPINVISTSTSLAGMNNPRTKSLRRFHERWGHIGQERVKREASSRKYPLIDDMTDSFCLGCVEGGTKPLTAFNSTATKNKKRAKQASKKLKPEAQDYKSFDSDKVIKVDVVTLSDDGTTRSAPHSIEVRGPGAVIMTDIFEVPTAKGNVKAVLFKDLATKWAHVYVIQKKSEIANALQSFRQTGDIIQLRGDVIYSDNEAVYRSAEFTQAVFDNGLRHCVPRNSPPYHPQANGGSEVYVRDIKRMSAAFMAAIKSHVPEEHRVALKIYAITHAAYVMNMLENKSTGKSPFEAIKGRIAPLGELRKFGCFAYVRLGKDQRNRYDEPFRRGYYVGHLERSGTYKVYMPDTNTIIESVDVDFDESFTQAKMVYDEDTGDALSYTGPLPPILPQLVPAATKKVTFSDRISTTSEDAPSTEASDSEGGVYNDASSTVTQFASGGDPRANFASGGDFKILNHQESAVTRAAAKKMNMTNKRTGIIARPHSTITINSLNASKVIPSYQATKGSRANLTLEAEKKEAKVYIDNKVFVEFANKQEVLTHKEKKDFEMLNMVIAYSEKYDSSGNFVKMKARAAINGKHQQSVADDGAYVMNATSQRTLSALAVQLGWEIRQADFTAAFLQTKIKNQNIWVRLPPRFRNQLGTTAEYGRLGKCAYGLKQASAEWCRYLTKWFVTHGFTKFNSDPCLFKRQFPRLGTIIVGVSTDDLKSVAENSAVYDHFIAMVAKDFDVKDLGRLEWYLGIRYEQDLEKGTIMMIQDNFISNLTENYGLDKAQPVNTVLPRDMVTADDKQTTSEESSADMIRKVKSAVGSLQYVASNTRLDVAWAVRRVTLFANYPTAKLWENIQWIIRYLYSTRHLGLTYHRQQGEDANQLKVYTDASYADDPALERRSTGGFASMLNGAAIHWKVKRLDVCLSTAEAEYHILCHAGRHACHDRERLRESGFEQLKPTTIYSDSESAMAIANTERIAQRSKHIDVRYHWIREQIINNVFETKYIRTHDQPADLFTKNLPPDVLAKHRATLMGLSE